LDPLVYDLVKYIHVLAAIVWVGGAFFAQLLAIRAARSTDPMDIPIYGRTVAFVAGRAFPIASITLLIAGVILVIGRYSFTQIWVTISLVLWVASLVVGAFYLGPRARRIGELFAQEGPGSTAARSLMDQAFLISRLELVAFAVIVFLMVFKPGS
jgi:uncharacterized membrane protein